MKTMNLMKSIFAVVVMLFALSGCAGNMAMQALEMHSAPDFSSKMPDNITVIRLALNAHLDLSDTAFYPDFGVPNSTTWPFYLCAPGQKDINEAKKLMAIRFELSKEQQVLLVYIPEKLENIKNHTGFLTDHAGKRIYSADSKKMAYVPNLTKVKPENFPDVVKPIGSMNTIEAVKGTKQYEDLMSLLDPFKKAAEENWKEALKVRDDYLKAYDIPVGINLSEEQAKILLNDQSFQEKMMSLLTDDWYGVITFPLWTPEQYGVSMLITKVFQIPTKFWKDDLNKPGYMDRTLTASQGAAMILHYKQSRQ